VKICALPARVASELYKMEAGVEAVYVGYKSNPQAIPDLQSGLLTFMMIDTVNAKIKQGGLIAKLMTTKKFPEERITDLYLRCISRKPTKEERMVMNSHPVLGAEIIAPVTAGDAFQLDCVAPTAGALPFGSACSAVPADGKRCADDSLCITSADAPGSPFCSAMCRNDADCPSDASGQARCVEHQTAALPNGSYAKVGLCTPMSKIAGTACVRERDCAATEGCLGYGARTALRICRASAGTKAMSQKMAPILQPSGHFESRIACRSQADRVSKIIRLGRPEPKPNTSITRLVPRAKKNNRVGMYRRDILTFPTESG
jgi:hypothetical protein